MHMITGGAFQGKREFAKNYFKTKNMTNGEICGFDEVFSAECIYNFHMLVKRLTAENINCIEFTERIIRENKNLIVIINEIGCGIVPIDKNERIWRENVGKCGCMIAAASEKVIRIFYGKAVFIKN